MRIFSDRMFGLAVICLYLSFIPAACAESISIQYFHQKGCQDCKITDPVIDQIDAQYKNNSVVISRIFGLGLVGSYLVLGLCLLSFRKSIPDLESKHRPNTK